MVFGGIDGDGQGLTYRDHHLPCVTEFKFLGTWFNQAGNWNMPADRQATAVYATWCQAREWAHMQGLTKYTHVMRRIIQVYVLSVALFGCCQVWGPDALMVFCSR